MLSLLPTEAQLKNRKVQLQKSESGGEIRNTAAIMQWGNGKECETLRDFLGHDDAQPGGEPVFAPEMEALLDDLVILKIVQVGDMIAIILSSRRILLNIRQSVLGQKEDGVFGATDGTYKLHFGGWTLVNFGTFSTRYNRGAYSKHFVPWTFMFVRTENEAAYRELFSATQEFSQSVFGMDLHLRFGSPDHSSAIANAFSAEWPEIQLLNCWPHFVRKSREKAVLLKTKNYYQDVIYPHIQWMRDARTLDQFQAIGRVCLDKWIAGGELEYGSWFEEQYFSAPWGTWFAGVAGDVAGILPSQNPIEAFHRIIKKVAVSALRASTATVLNSTLPKIIRMAGLEWSKPEALVGVVPHYGIGK